TPLSDLNWFPSELVEERQVVKEADFEEFDGIDEVARSLIGKVMAKEEVNIRCLRKSMA
ncbi:hypothetical protein Tco_1199251, partial [Tanacetum coccineum]